MSEPKYNQGGFKAKGGRIPMSPENLSDQDMYKSLLESVDKMTDRLAQSETRTLDAIGKLDTRFHEHVTGQHKAALVNTKDMHGIKDDLKKDIAAIDGKLAKVRVTAGQTNTKVSGIAAGVAVILTSIVHWIFERFGGA